MGHHQWRWDPRKFEIIDKPHVATQALEHGWAVTVMDSELAWGYCIPFSADAKAHILWSAAITVLAASGEVSPGLSFHDQAKGILFQINTVGNTAELRLLEVGVRTVRAALFEIPPIAYPYDMVLEYNALTSKCAGCVDSDKIFEIQLPYRDVPAISDVEALEIVTTISEEETEGRVEYGTLRLLSE